VIDRAKRMPADARIIPQRACRDPGTF
jgi:hypothetical protein